MTLDKNIFTHTRTRFALGVQQKKVVLSTSLPICLFASVEVEKLPESCAILLGLQVKCA